MKLKSIASKLLLGIGLLALCVMPINAQEAFTIEDYDVTMNVEENGMIHIQETLILDFNEYRHGFYRNIPTKYDMTWMIDGKSVDKSYYFPVKDIDCGATACAVDYDSDGIVVRLGDEDEEVIGEQFYTLSYTVKTKDLDIMDTQMLYWNLADNFDTTIKHLSFTINMPKPFDEKAVSAYSGYYGSSSVNMQVNVDGNTIHGETMASLGNYEAATVMVRLPSDYFQFPLPIDLTFPLMIFAAVLLVVSLILFWKFGKDDDVVVTVEFNAPKGLNSAGVGYVIDGSVESHDVLSLIIEWANKGYLKIRESKEHLTLVKLQDIPKESSTDYERKFFEAIFKQKDEVDEEDLGDGRVGEALYRAKSNVKSYFERTKKRRVFAQSSIVMQTCFIFVAGLPLLVFPLVSAYAYYEILSISMLSVLPAVFFMVTLVGWIVLMH